MTPRFPLATLAACAALLLGACATSSPRTDSAPASDRATLASESPAASTSQATSAPASEAGDEKKQSCGCSGHGDTSAQTASAGVQPASGKFQGSTPVAAKGCKCPHCSKVAKGEPADGVPCGCSH